MRLGPPLSRRRRPWHFAVRQRRLERSALHAQFPGRSYLATWADRRKLDREALHRFGCVLPPSSLHYVSLFLDFSLREYWFLVASR